MPRAFDVTTASTTLELDALGQGEVAFTVSNALHQPIRVRAVLEPAGNTRPEWLSVPEGTERNLSPDGTEQFTVKVSVPKGTPPGPCSFSLLVVSVTNPDEHYARGPDVAFTVPKTTPVAVVKKAFPWRLVVLVGVGVVIGGVVAKVAWRGKEPPPGLWQACAEKPPQCGEKLTCEAEKHVCLGTVGFEGCTSNEQCVDSICVRGKCALPSKPGGPCQQDAECEPPGKCEEERCRLAEGEPCTEAVQCSSGHCTNERCLAFSPGDSCGRDQECRSPAECERGRCRLPGGQPCTEEIHCITGHCVGGKCTEPFAPGATCVDTWECRSPAKCESGRCRLPDGEPCTAASQCSSGRCTKERCLALSAPGDSCGGDPECRPPARCERGRCRLPGGQPCTEELQCSTGHCVNGKCMEPFAPGATCVDTWECRAPAKCTNGRCLLENFQPCTANDQCLSGSCVRGERTSMWCKDRNRPLSCKENKHCPVWSCFDARPEGECKHIGL